MKQRDLFTANVLDGKRKSSFSESRENIMNKVAAAVTERVRVGNKEPIIIQAGTGIGKSTTFLYNLHKLNPVFRIICSQVTNANVKSLFEYVATMPGMTRELNIGYQSGQGFSDIQGSGILYQTIKTTTNNVIKPLIDHQQNAGNVILIIDEAHVNDINMIEQLAFLKHAYSAKAGVPTNAMPFVIVQSASINPFEYAKYLNSHYIISITGQQFVIADVFLESIKEHPDFRKDREDSVSYCAAQAVKQILTATPDSDIGKAISKSKTNKDGPILIFVSTQQMILDVRSAIEKTAEHCKEMEYLPIFPLSRMQIEQNYRIVQQIVQSSGKCVIISTNVIETGFTIPNLSYVIDTLKYLQVYYNPVTKAEVMRYMPVSLSMYQQRRGRVGRLRGGVHIALAPQSIVKQLKEEELCVQFTDLKQMLIDSGDAFQDLEFMADIPEELIIDAMQAQIVTGWTSSAVSIHLNLLNSDQLRISVSNRYLIVNILQLGGRLVDAIQLVIFIENMETRSSIKPKRQGLVNDFLECLQAIKDTPIHMFPFSYTQLFAKACQHMLSVNLDIYQGEPLLARPDILNAAIQATYRLNVLTLQSTDSGRALYKTLQGIKVSLKIKTGAPQYLTFNKLNDLFGRFKVDFVAEIPEPDFSDLCTTANAHRKRSSSK